MNVLTRVGHRIDPCAAYAARNFTCPSFVNVGSINAVDVLPLETLLSAAGVHNLDMGGGSGGGLPDESLRFSGIILLVQIEYTNFFLSDSSWPGDAPGTSSFDMDTVNYNYRVSMVANANFNSASYLVNSTTIPTSNRVTYTMAGIRVAVTQAGRIGSFDVFSLLVNVIVGMGLLAIAETIVNFIALNVLPLRFLYRRLITKNTVDMTSVMAHLPKEQKTALDKRLREDPFAIDPIPPFLLDVLAERKLRIDTLDDDKTMPQLSESLRVYIGAAAGAAAAVTAAPSHAVSCEDAGDVVSSSSRARAVGISSSFRAPTMVFDPTAPTPSSAISSAGSYDDERGQMEV